MSKPRIYIIVFSILAIIQLNVQAVVLKESPVERQFYSQISNSFENVSLARDYDDSQESSSGQKTASERKVSMWKAGLYSALIPGMGEYYVGHKSKARVFFAVEAATWISFLSFQIYGNWRENDYVDYAAVHASANLDGKNAEFRDWVGFYSDIDQFNSFGRVQDQDRPYLDPASDNYWRWESSAAQDNYRYLKNRSREAYRRRDFMVGLAVVNRIVSIIDAVRDAKRSQREIKDSGFSLVDRLNYRFDINPLDSDNPVKFAIYSRF